MRIACALAAALAAVQAGQPPPRFTVTTSRVRLDVGVTDSNGPVRGLRDDDFVVTDGGLRQHVRVEQTADAPLDLVLVAQPVASLATTSSQQAARMPSAIAASLSQVDARDRVGVILAGAPPTRLRPLSAGPASLEASAFSRGSFAASVDALSAALGEFEPSDRRAVLIALINGVDARSTISFEALAQRARRLGPAFVIIGAPVRITEAVQVKVATMPGGVPRTLSEASVTGNMFPQTLGLLAKRTGGILVDVGRGDPAAIVAELFQRLRTQYVVSYEPPPGKGWHPVTVTVARRGAIVNARDGYFVD